MRMDRFTPRAGLYALLIVVLLVTAGVTFKSRTAFPAFDAFLGRATPLERIRKFEAPAHRPFGIIDKTRATLDVYGVDGQLLQSTPVLLGLAHGDKAPADIGSRPVKDILPHEKITQAGRYPVEFGQNLRGEQVMWLDYDAGLSMHPVLRTENRIQRLDSSTIDDNRISAGCINMPADAHASLLRLFDTPQGGVVYVLPEQQDVDQWLISQGIR